MKRTISAANHLQRRVRPRREEDYSDMSVATSSEESESQARVEDNTISEDESSNGVEDDDQSDEEENFSEHLGSISFGALARAQESLQSHRASNTTAHTSSSSRLADLRRRLQEIRNAKTSSAAGDKNRSKPSGPSKRQTSHAPPSGRANKHAPAEQSSKKAVSRKREVLAIPNRAVRDPRFEALSGPLDEENVRKNYSFLDEYREDEMKQLREKIKKTKDEDVKGMLKRELLSMESRKKAQETKDKQQEILKEHRAKEKELIKQGKKPYYLKKAEQKRLLLIDRFANLKGKQVDRVIERKRRKNAAKEKRDMPRSRRGVV